MKTSEKADMHNQHWLTSRFSPFSAPWTNLVTKGKCMQVQRCSKPTHDHAASLREVGARSRTAWRGPAYQLALRIVIIGLIMVRGPIRYTVRGTLPLGNSFLLLRCI